ncbi:hypothetical protein B0H15DRAFT_174369 [Mycena belliarum]|uniref:Uncharacterized protein n=1 Tax=Mycena belliarum TaxID=1033014 RepID=A0AAD6XP22_9AGAR|nr:hypothetical protein B0H15DRAFT_174369 [Mycena belliae]
MSKLLLFLDAPSIHLARMAAADPEAGLELGQVECHFVLRTGRSETIYTCTKNPTEPQTMEHIRCVPGSQSRP